MAKSKPVDLPDDLRSIEDLIEAGLPVDRLRINWFRESGRLRTFRVGGGRRILFSEAEVRSLFVAESGVNAPTNPPSDVCTTCGAYPSHQRRHAVQAKQEAS